MLTNKKQNSIDNFDRFSNKEISKLLRNVAAVYVLKKELNFKIIAYVKAADAIELLGREVHDVWKEGKSLYEITGIGKTIASHLDEYFKNDGKKGYLLKQLERVPASVFVFMELPAVGPKRAYKLANELKIEDKKNALLKLSKAAEQGRVAELDSFGKKIEDQILSSIKHYLNQKKEKQRMALPYAVEMAAEIIEYLRKDSKIIRADALGSLRRMVPTIGDIDIAVSLENEKDTTEIVKKFINYPKKIRVDNSGEAKASIIVSPDIRVDLRVQSQRNYGSMLQYFTGSKSHNISLRDLARKKGLSLSEYGIKPLTEEVKKLKFKKYKKNYNQKNNIFEFDNEIDFYEFVGLHYVEPELREDTGEIYKAEMNKLPNLVKTVDIRGDFHIHSSYNIKTSHDLGQNSYEEICQKALELGYEYIGFSDHNPRMSNNSSDTILTDLKERKAHIDQIFRSKKYERIKYFIGIEADILPNGNIALPEGAERYLDYIIVSVHSSMKMGIDEMTSRVLKAFDFPKVKIFGHPTGRLLNKREGYELYWKEVFKKAKEKNIAMEINSWPERLDLPDSLVREGIDYNLKYFINTDAHAVEQMDGINYGVTVARRGWAEKNDIINTMSYDEVRNWMER